MNRIIRKFLMVSKLALSNLFIHKLRAFLTLLGIVIGIATVTFIVSAGEGLKGFVLKQVEGFGSNTLFVEARPPELEIVLTIITTLKTSQMEEIIRSDAFPHINKGYAYAATQAVAQSPYEEITVDVNGTNADYIEIDSAEIASGRFMSERDNLTLKKVVVLGSEAAQKLFPVGDPVNQKIKLNNQSFTVIGVLKEKGPDLFMNVDKMAFIPVRVLQKFYSGTDWIPYFALQVDDAKYLDQSKEEVIQFLRKKHGIQSDSKDDFAVTTSEEAMEIVNTVLMGVSILLFCLALISLVVGGVGIMNIMYVTVTERIKEIGLRKAVGAKASDILLQFIFEAIIITGIGGIIGALLGMFLTYIAAFYAQDYGFQWEYVVSFDAILAAVLVAMFCGVVFGLAPARKAARLDPIEALR